MDVTFTEEECRALLEGIGEAGVRLENGFAWDGTDDPEDPGLRALAKLFRAVGREVPESMRAIREKG